MHIYIYLFIWRDDTVCSSLLILFLIIGYLRRLLCKFIKLNFSARSTLITNINHFYKRYILLKLLITVSL